MCGRFHFGEDTERDIRRIAAYLDGKIHWNRYGDIYPSDRAVILTGKRPGLLAEDMRWGFPGYQSGRLLINARAETVLERKTFSDSVLHRRCVIAADAFYEWDKNKTKVTFTLPEKRSVYMAGFYRRFDGEDRFIILTTGANVSMLQVHDRMPLILKEEEIRDWICEDSQIADFLGQASPLLSSQQDFEQMKLPF